MIAYILKNGVFSKRYRFTRAEIARAIKAGVRYNIVRVNRKTGEVALFSDDTIICRMDRNSARKIFTFCEECGGLIPEGRFCSIACKNENALRSCRCVVDNPKFLVEAYSAQKFWDDIYRDFYC